MNLDVIALELLKSIFAPGVIIALLAYFGKRYFDTSTALRLEQFKADLAAANGAAAFKQQTAFAWFHRQQAEAVHAVAVAHSRAIRSFSNCIRPLNADEVPNGDFKQRTMDLANEAIEAHRKFRATADDNRHLLTEELRDGVKIADKVLFDALKLHRGSTMQPDGTCKPDRAEELNAALSTAVSLRFQLEAYVHALLTQEDPEEAVKRVHRRLKIKSGDSDDENLPAST